MDGNIKDTPPIVLVPRAADRDGLEASKPRLGRRPRGDRPAPASRRGRPIRHSGSASAGSRSSGRPRRLDPSDELHRRRLPLAVRRHGDPTRHRTRPGRRRRSGQRATSPGPTLDASDFDHQPSTSVSSPRKRGRPASRRRPHGRQHHTAAGTAGWRTADVAAGHRHPHDRRERRAIEGRAPAAAALQAGTLEPRLSSPTTARASQPASCSTSTAAPVDRSRRRSLATRDSTARSQPKLASC